MSIKLIAVEFNTDARVITALFAFYLIVVTFTVSYFGSFFTVTTPLHGLVGAIAIFAEAAVGFRAARMFGGRRNFTGKLITYYSVALSAQALSWVFWGVFAGGQIPSGLTEIVLGLGSIFGQVLSAYALLISARAVIIKIDKKIVGIILGSLAFSSILSILIEAYHSTITDLIVWSGVWPTSIFVQLASGLILVSMLGKWYMARPIANIAFAYIAFSISTSLVIMLRLILQFPWADFWVIISVIEAVSFYLVGLSMSQVRPMSHDQPVGTQLPKK